MSEDVRAFYLSAKTMNLSEEDRQKLNQDLKRRESPERQPWFFGLSCQVTSGEGVELSQD